MTGLLPDGFETLEPFASFWAGETAADRAHLRAAHPASERDAFFAACAPLLKDGLAYLDQKPLGEYSQDESRLMRMFLTFAHVAHAVEVQGPDEARHTSLRQSMRITRAPADQS